MNRLRFAAKWLVHGAIDYSGRPRRERRRLRGKLIILTYHSFCNTWPRGLFHSLPIDRFERQIRFLKQYFTVVSLEQGLSYLEQACSTEKPWVAITIDDGFRDNHTHAWPILQRHSIPATIFLATDFIDHCHPPWPTQLIEIFERTEITKLESLFRADLSSATERSRVAERLKQTWTPLSPQERSEELEALRRHLRVDVETRYPGLTWDQIRKMRASGIFFGSHTVYHSILPAVAPAVATRELHDSKRRIETELQEECSLFAYPDGKHNRLLIDTLRTCGYRAAVTQDFGFNAGIKEWFALKRIEVPFHDPLPTFRARVSFATRHF